MIEIAFNFIIYFTDAIFFYQCYSTKGVPPPGAALAARRMRLDPRDEPQYGERVPYVMIRSEDRLQIDRAMSPAEFLANP